MKIHVVVALFALAFSGPAIAAGAPATAVLVEAGAAQSPYTGTVAWTTGVDEAGNPTLKGRVDIPSRGLSADILVRRNLDPGIPASHLIQVDFEPADSFEPKYVAQLDDLSFKRQQSGATHDLIGASARVQGNSFLFALSGQPDDRAANLKLLSSEGWIDLGVGYAAGQHAELSLEIDPASRAIWNAVLTAWAGKD